MKENPFFAYLTLGADVSMKSGCGPSLNYHWTGNVWEHPIH